MSTSDTEYETEGEEVQQVSVKNTVWCPIENCRNEQVRKQFLAEYRNGQRSLQRKCVTCSTIIQASNGGTTNLMNHLKFCKTRVAKQPGQPSETIIYVASYLRELAAQDDSLNGSITQVLEKHVSNNAVIHALTHEEGPFYNFVQTKLATAKSIKKRRDDQDKNENLSSLPTHGLLDHTYTPVAVMPQKPMTFNDFLSRKRPAPSLDLSSVLLNLKPTSVDPERSFSLGRLSKNHLQGRMSAQQHDRNVFLKKRPSHLSSSTLMYTAVHIFVFLAAVFYIFCL